MRIVQMMQKGELDAAVAMQLLGGAGDLLGGSKKRPLEDGQASGSNSQEGAEGDDGASLDDLLETAKRAKLETKIN